MKLPNARLALVAREKISDYLLNAAHPDNGGKAEFFDSLGFRRDEWEVLARAFRALVGNFVNTLTYLFLHSWTGVARCRHAETQPISYCPVTRRRAGIVPPRCQIYVAVFSCPACQDDPPCCGGPLQR